MRWTLTPFAPMPRALTLHTSMNKLQELDIVLGEALEQVNDSARLVRACDEIETKTHLRKVGHAMNSLWEIRDEIYKIEPSLKSELLSEYEKDESRCEVLSELHHDAHELESLGNFDGARKKYERLLKESTYGHFK